MRNAGLEEAQAGIMIAGRKKKIAGRNSNNLRYADDATLMAESEKPLDENESGVLASAAHVLKLERYRED